MLSSENYSACTVAICRFHSRLEFVEMAPIYFQRSFKVFKKDLKMTKENPMFNCGLVVCGEWKEAQKVGQVILFVDVKSFMSYDNVVYIIEGRSKATFNAPKGQKTQVHKLGRIIFISSSYIS